MRVFDGLRPILTMEGRGQLWTRIAHRGEVHQTTPYTAEDRYPELFDLAAKLRPDVRRILSFGCSTGEELVALRRRFPGAEIVGAEINSRSRRIAARRVALDDRAAVISPREISGSFDLIFALAVFQREPHKVVEMEIEDLSAYYPFERFERTVTELTHRLEPDGLMCVFHAHYPVEQTSAATQLEPIADSPWLQPPLFGRDSRRLPRTAARTIFRKRG